MAQKAPNPVDVTEYQFKLHCKRPILNISENKNNVNLLAAASNYGLIFVGNPEKCELKVLQLQNLIQSNEKDEKLRARVISLPSIPHCIAVSCDGSLLAVNYTINDSSFLSFYSVPSFLSAKVSAKLNIRVSPDDNVLVLQILWNPVIPSTLAVVLDNGSLGMYNLKESGFEFHSIDKHEQVRCACWSPKGKQIVLGFPHGKLVQYKPDLKVARTIVCPENIHETPFNTIAVQWLSNFQFAAVFLQEGEDMSPALYIVNAPKSGNPSYVNYHDISYSQCGFGKAQIFLIHIQSWNVLLMTTSNSMEAGILGTKETGENPTWIQYTTLDEARLEMPLTSDKQDTFPIGFCLETGCTHQVAVGENKFPVMPMIHVLSTNGLLISYDFLNLTPNAPGICSPPNVITDISGLDFFKPVDEQCIETAPAQQMSDITFSVPSGATSTPAADRKAKSIFGDKSAETLGFFNSATSVSPFASIPASSVSTLAKPNSFSGLFSSTSSQQNQAITVTNTLTQPQAFPSKNLFNQFGSNSSFLNSATGAGINQSFGAPENSITGKSLIQKSSMAEKSKPLYTIPSTYTVTTQQQQTPSQEQKFEENKISSANDLVVHDIIKELITTLIESFQLELRELSARSKDINISIGNMDESKMCTKRLNDLQEISDRAVEKDLEYDIQILRHALSEAFSMIAEVKSKLTFYKQPELPELAGTMSLNQTNRRQIANLKNLVATNETQLQVIQQQIDAQWAGYQDLVRQNARRKLHIPGLEGIYQTLTKQEDILAKQRIKIEYIKSKLGVREIFNTRSNMKTQINVESLADSILSISLANQIKTETSRLTESKRNTIKECLINRKINKIKPQRPDRIGMNSEVILEKKLRVAWQREGAVTKPEKMEKTRIQIEQSSIAKPMATKPFANILGNASGSPSIKKVEPKSISLPHPQIQPFMQKPALPLTKAQIAVGSSNLQDNQPVNIFGGNSLNKLPSFASTSSTGFFTGNQNVQVPLSMNNEPAPLGEMKLFEPTIEAKVADKEKSVIGLVPFKGDQKGMEPKEKNESSFTSNLPNEEPKIGISLGGSAFSFSGKMPSNFLKEKSEENIIKSKTENVSDPCTPRLLQSSTKSEANLLLEKDVEANKKGNSVVGFPPQNEPLSLNLGSDVNSFTTKSNQAVASSASNTTITTSLTINTSGFTLASGAVQPVSSFSFNRPIDSIASEAVVSNSHSILQDVIKVTTAVVTTAPSTNPETVITPKTTSTTFPSFSFGGLSSTIPTPVTIASEVPVGLTNKPIDAPDNLFSSMNICSPTTSESGAAKTTTSNIFGKSLLESTTFTSSGSFAKPIFGKPISGTAGSLFTSIAATTTSSSLVSTPTSVPVTTSMNAPLPLNVSTVTVSSSTFRPCSTVSSAPTSTTSSSVTWGISASNTNTTSTEPAFGDVATSTSIFGSTGLTSSMFGGQSVATLAPFMSTTTTSVPLFGTVTPSTSGSPFGGVTTMSSAPVFGSTNTFANVSSSSSIFGVTSTVATSPNIFGGIPKPDQSILAAASSATSSPFGVNNTAGSSFFRAPSSAQVSSGDNIFGSTSTATGVFGSQSGTSAGSIFGGAPAISQSRSPFGIGTTTTNQAESSTNIFGSPSQQTQGGGGSLFGTSAFGGGTQTTGSIFGGGGTSASPFGGSSFGQINSSPFGGATQQQNSPFGAGGFGQSTGFGSGSSTFGAQTTGFNSPSGGSFAQGGPSIAQTGFSSPTQFPKPTFGGPPTFGSPPSFGTTSSFGGAPTFGSTKSAFGGFGATNTGAFSPPTQKNALFESLGSSDTGLSFGNLAQSANTNNSKPQFGGSQFSSWR